MARRATHRLGSLVAAAGLALAALSSVALHAPVARACDAVPVPFERVAERADQIFLVTVAQRSMAGAVPQNYTLVVREVLRGELPQDVTLPTTVTIAAPVLDGCGTVLDARLTWHLVLALDVPAFDGAEPLTVAWRLLPDGRLEQRNDDGPPIWADLDAFKAGLAGRAFATPPPTPAPAPMAGEVEGVPLASVGIVAALVVGVIAGVLVVLMGRRAARPRTPRPPAAG
jgi:hypothetical protein